MIQQLKEGHDYRPDDQQQPKISQNIPLGQKINMDEFMKTFSFKDYNQVKFMLHHQNRQLENELNPIYKEQHKNKILVIAEKSQTHKTPQRFSILIDQFQDNNSQQQLRGNIMNSNNNNFRNSILLPNSNEGLNLNENSSNNSVNNLLSLTSFSQIPNLNSLGGSRKNSRTALSSQNKNNEQNSQNQNESQQLIRQQQQQQQQQNQVNQQQLIPQIQTITMKSRQQRNSIFLNDPRAFQRRATKNKSLARIIQPEIDEKYIPRSLKNLELELPTFVQQMAHSLQVNFQCQELLQQRKLKIDQIAPYIQKFLQFSIFKNKEYNYETFLPLKLPRQLMQLAWSYFKSIMQKNNYLKDIIDDCHNRVQESCPIIEEGKVIDEIGGTHGLHQIVMHIFKDQSQNGLMKFEIQDMMRQMSFETTFFRNLHFILSEKEDYIDYKRMIQAHYTLNITQIEVYQLKLLFWQILRFQRQRPETIYRFLAQIEKCRYFVQMRESFILLFNDSQLFSTMVSQLDFALSQEQQLMTIFHSDSELQHAFAEMLITELVLRKKYKLIPDIFLKELQMSLSQFQKVTNCLLKIVATYVNDEYILADTEIKMNKLAMRAGIMQSGLDKLGGEEGVLRLIHEIHNIVTKSEFFIATLRQFPEEAQHLRFVDQSFLMEQRIQKKQKYNINLQQQSQQQKQKSKMQLEQQDSNHHYSKPDQKCEEGSDDEYNNEEEIKAKDQEIWQKLEQYGPPINTGLGMLQFFIISFFSEHDLYSSCDFMAGILTCKIAKFIPIKWKFALELAMNNLQYPNDFSQFFIKTISKEFLTIYTADEKEYYNAQLSF